MMTEIITNINKHISDALQQLDNTDKWPYKAYVKVIGEIDYRAFLGLIYYRGLYGQNNFKQKILFSNEHGMPVFSATMSKMRFEFTLKFLCFNDYQTSNER